MIKTNAMRLLDKAGISYKAVEYEYDESDLSGEHIADTIGLPYEQTFKTLVAKGDKTGPVVFCIPVCGEVDMKQAAKITKNKKIEMVHVKDLLALTGYIRGGCSPVGMKKRFPVFIDESCTEHDIISISSGMRGCQLLLNPLELIEFTDAVKEHLTV